MKNLLLPEAKARGATFHKILQYRYFPNQLKNGKFRYCQTVKKEIE